MELQRILIVDDDPSFQEMLWEYLVMLGFEVDKCGSAICALSLLDQYRYRAVLSDIHMNEMNGIELVEKTKFKGNTTPFILMTAFHRKDIAQKAKNLGVSAFFEKPFQLASLYSALMNLNATAQ